MKQSIPPAESTVQALANRFATTKANFACFSALAETGRPIVTIAFAAHSGLDLGQGLRSWREIFDDKHDKKGTFLIRVGKKSYDCRAGMTMAIYEKIMERNRMNTGILPDSQEWAEASGDDWTWTMLTGNCVIDQKSKEALDLVRAGLKVLRGTNSMPLVSTMKDNIYMTGSNPSEESPAVRFRPAVILGEVG